MASQKGLIPPNIVNEPTFSSNPHLGQICKALLDETEKKNKLHLEMQSAYQRGRVSTVTYSTLTYYIYILHII